MKKTVAHSLYSYLFYTGSWIYSQIIGLDKFNNIVVTNSKQNLDIFPYAKIFSLSDCNMVYQNYVNIYRKLFSDYTPFVYSVLKDNKVSLLHSHFGSTGWRDLTAKKKMNIPQITTFYGVDISQRPKKPIWQKRYKQLFEECDLFTVEGDFMKQTLVNLGCRTEKVVVQHLGVDLDRIKYIPRRIEEDGLIKILISGRFIEKKGLTYAVEAFARVQKKYDNLRLTIIGNGETDIEDQIQFIIDKYNLGDYVQMLGSLTYPAFIEESKKHHLFLSPSVHANSGDSEGGAPVSIIEMSAAGMPIISTFHCDIPSVVINGETGFLAEERNVIELVEKLELLIEHPDLWIKMGEAGRKHILENYEIKKQIIKQSAIYEKLM